MPKDDSLPAALFNGLGLVLFAIPALCGLLSIGVPCIRVGDPGRSASGMRLGLYQRSSVHF
jgi:hypothetical protein